ncbi:oxygen-independent coproporphyrinogen III oxidase [Rubritalea tangerina]|uniref:Coproporphyrinogen-III oxidase n=1 Tax=Rubritalea tangerina TaxID=430798 RepID=A0ABW4Z7E5_9BACT
MLKPDLRLVEKYNKPGPRYTSYPTAPQFSESVNHQQLLQETQKDTGPLSLYFHIPFCQSMCWFCGCTKIISNKREPAERYLHNLEREIQLYPENANRPVQQLHFGGGTPNYLTPDQIQRFGNTLRNHFDFAHNAEISAELDPRRLTQEHIQAFQTLGVNRVSFGMQDVQLSTQKAVNRVQSDTQNRNAIDWARSAGIHSLNIDLIYGLPHQTPESIRNTIQHILSYDPDRLAVFSYAHVPWIAPAQKILERHGLPEAEAKIQMLGVIIEELTSNGYQYIGMDHFAKINDPLAVAQRNKTMQRNFQGYSTFRDLEIRAFGITSISQTQNSYRQNVKDLNAYEQALDQNTVPISKGYLLTQDDHIRRTTIMRLMCDHTLDYSQLSRELDIDFADYFRHEIHGLVDMEIDGLLERSETSLKVTPQGTLFIRNIAMFFDAHLAQSSARHSRTV